MFCTKCGAEIQVKARFCTKCGAAVEQPKIEQSKEEQSKEEQPKVKQPKIEQSVSGSTQAEDAGGNRLQTTGLQSGGRQENDSSADLEQEQAVAKKRKKRRRLKIVIAFIAAALVIGVVSFFVFGGMNMARAYYNLSLGNRYLEKMDYEQAIACFEEAIEIDPNISELYIALADVYVEMGDYEQAVEVLETGLKITGSSRIEEHYEQLMNRIRGFVGKVYAADKDLNGDNNEPLKDVHVTVAGEKEGDTYTDRKGDYVIDHLSKGKYSLTFSADGYISYTTEVDLGNERYHMDVVLESLAFAGRVYAADTNIDENDNAPLKDVHVTMEGEKEGDTYTDVNGDYLINHLSKGKYSLTFSADGYISYTTEADLGDERHHMDVVLEPASYANMYGTVMIADEDTNYANNHPLTDAKIELHKLTGSIPYDGTTVTDEKGQYTFKDIVMGVYELTVQKEGYQSTTQRVAVYEGQTICYNIMIEVIGNEWQGAGTASGMVYDAVTGYGVEGLTLNIRKGINQLDGPVAETLKTSEDGSYATPKLESGNYTIEILDERRDVEETYLGSTINIKVLGGLDISNQNGTVSTGILSGQVRIVMSWGATPSDLDSHLWCSLSSGDQYHIYYREKTFDLGGVTIADLDLDDTDCYGPETTTIYTPDEGIYIFGVYDYSHDSNKDLKKSGAVVQVYMENSMVPSYIFYVPTKKGYYWEVFSYDSSTHQLTPINKVYEDLRNF